MHSVLYKIIKTNRRSNGGPIEMKNYQILFICTSADKGSWGGKTGLWLDELSIPYYIFKEAGYEVDIYSIKGGSPAIDPAIFTNEGLDESTAKFLADLEAQNKFCSALSINSMVASDESKSDSKSEDFSLNDYSAIYLCGGHGCVEDFINNSSIKRIVENMYSIRKGCVGAICHGPLGLVNCRNGDKLLLDGKFVAAFSNEEESELGLRDLLPVLTEELMDQQGAICVPAQPWKPHVVVDGRLVTAQNPQSSLEVALRMLDVLRSLGDDFSSPLNVNKPWGK